jgi:hypothetical protein
MEHIFHDAVEFNQSIENWNVSNLSWCTYMFANTREFNQPLDKWQLNDARYVRFMFRDAIKFNQSLNSWNFDRSETQKTFENCGISYENLPDDQKNKYKMILVEI